MLRTKERRKTIDQKLKKAEKNRRFINLQMDNGYSNVLIILSGKNPAKNKK